SAFVLGGNRLIADGQLLERVNVATPQLLNSKVVLNRLKEMAEGTADNELPSCNLLLRRGLGHRYPDVRSAEDHWLVARLLLQHSSAGAILQDVLYSDYTLTGKVTSDCLSKQLHSAARRSLFAAASTWSQADGPERSFLGQGQEGVVSRIGATVEKRFYPGVLGQDRVNWMQHHLPSSGGAVVAPTWFGSGSNWACTYPWEPSEPADVILIEEAQEFLRWCLSAGVVCSNVKRTNFRRVEGRLKYIDIGNSIVPMDIDVFMDAAARLYAISELALPDDELLRRKRGPDALADDNELPGYGEFYAQTLEDWAASNWRVSSTRSEEPASFTAANVTLMIKACSMNAEHLSEQVRHIVRQLRQPRRFAETILAIDAFQGPFLRQHAEGNLNLLLQQADELRSAGLIDRVLVAPLDAEAIREVNERWFGVASSASHNARGVPVAPQLWAFEQVATRYVLQCDIDVLICRNDHAHDYLADMLAACDPQDVLGVAFNIPHEAAAGWRPYDAPPGEYVPEVRCGLLDLSRLHASRPWHNQEVAGALELSWYRSLQQ
ncbi:MAG: glycosyltransferase, partial [Planctomycetes bacterium]|nr:glycosyltransferase [Planctomycetota bacterium]